jgi:chromate reductase
LGGLRSQIVLQVLLHKLGVLVIPSSFALSTAHKAFDEKGRLKEANAEKMVRGVGTALVELTSNLARGPHLSDRRSLDSSALPPAIAALASKI